MSGNLPRTKIAGFALVAPTAATGDLYRSRVETRQRPIPGRYERPVAHRAHHGSGWKPLGDTPLVLDPTASLSDDNHRLERTPRSTSHGRLKRSGDAGYGVVPGSSDHETRVGPPALSRLVGLEPPRRVTPMLSANRLEAVFSRWITGTGRWSSGAIPTGGWDRGPPTSADTRGKFRWGNLGPIGSVEC